MFTRTSMEIQTDFIFCSGAATQVLKVGSSHLPSGEDVLLLIIPGNPGVVGFYQTFMQTLHGMLGYPVWAVSHAGHCAPPDSMDMVEDAAAAARRDVFGLDGQVRHKLAFLQNHVPRGTRLVLLGHSIGCYMILEMMKRDPELKVLKAVMLFPTIERMSQTPQGRVLTPLLCQLRYLAYLPLLLLSLLPERLASLLVRLAFSSVAVLDPCVLRPSVELLRRGCAGRSAGFRRCLQPVLFAAVHRSHKSATEPLEKVAAYSPEITEMSLQRQSDPAAAASVWVGPKQN
ncbi:lipid droplet-associated hydrolase isoform 3-T4 [Anableps anableps]